MCSADDRCAEVVGQTVNGEFPFRSHHAVVPLRSLVGLGVRPCRYYLAQIGLGLCPLSNDALFLKMRHSPVPGFIRRGLNVRGQVR